MKSDDKNSENSDEDEEKSDSGRQSKILKKDIYQLLIDNQDNME